MDKTWHNKTPPDQLRHAADQLQRAKDMASPLTHVEVKEALAEVAAVCAAVALAADRVIKALDAALPQNTRDVS